MASFFPTAKRLADAVAGGRVTHLQKLDHHALKKDDRMSFVYEKLKNTGPAAKNSLFAVDAYQFTLDNKKYKMVDTVTYAGNGSPLKKDFHDREFFTDDGRMLGPDVR
jgi:hypothetical protein